MEMLGVVPEVQAVIQWTVRIGDKAGSLGALVSAMG
jgi:hypothetical protein